MKKSLLQLSLIISLSLIGIPTLQAQQEEPAVATIDLADILGEGAEGSVDLMLLGVAAQDGNCMQSLNHVTTAATNSTLVLNSQCQPTDDEEATTCVPQSLAMKVLGNSVDAAHGLAVGVPEELSLGTLLLAFNIADDPKAAGAALLDPLNLIVCGVTNVAQGSVGRAYTGLKKGDWEMAARGTGTLVVIAAGVQSATSFAGETSASLLKRFGGSAALGDGIATLIADAGGTLTATAARPAFAYGAIVQPLAQSTAAVAALAGLGNTVHMEGTLAISSRNDTTIAFNRTAPPQDVSQPTDFERAMKPRLGEDNVTSVAVDGVEQYAKGSSIKGLQLDSNFWNPRTTIDGTTLEVFSTPGAAKVRVIVEATTRHDLVPRPRAGSGIFRVFTNGWRSF